MKMAEKKRKEDNETERPVVARTAADLQRLKLMKLMKNPEKPVILPERHKAKGIGSTPEFVRNVMGSSAGAGSGEFHVYRHLRRKEYSRQKMIKEKGKQETLDDQYHDKLEENKRKAEETTSKKRAKRLKKKQKQKNKVKSETKEECKEENNVESGEDSEDESKATDNIDEDSS